MGSTSAASWRVELWYRGQLRSTTRRDVVLVGDGGHVVVPSLNGSHVLACGDRIECVEGLVGVDARGCAPALDARTTLHVAAHPEIEVVLVRERLERVEVSRVPMLPLREAVYGLAFAACVCAFISAKVAVSPARVREKEDRELAQELLVDVPMAFVVPPPVVEAAPMIDPEPRDAMPSSELDGVDPENVDVPEVSEVAQLVAEAPPKPKAKRRRARRESFGPEGGGSAQLLAMDLIRSNDDDVYAALTGVDTAFAMKGPDVPVKMLEAVPEEVPLRVPGWVPGSVPGEVQAEGERNDPDVEGIDAERTCAMQDDPKARVDIVFVVDATAPMAKVHSHLAQQVADLNRGLVDARYGLVAFGDDVELAKLEPMSSTALAAALEDMKVAAETRPLDAEVRDDVLGALDRAREFPWGDTRDTLRLIVLVTDNDYGDRGDALGEHTVGHSHARVAEQLADASIRVSSITRRRVPGLDRERDGHPSIPAATAGIALRESVVYPRGGLADALADLLRNPVCLENLADVLVGE